MPLLPHLHRVCDGTPLDADGARAAMESILSGEVSHVQIAAFLGALRVKGVTVDELTGFARAMRDAAAPVRPRVEGPLVDTCGTGGDGAGTFNISTIAAFVTAGAGVRVAKHGNRSASGRAGSGSADLMEGLGVSLALSAVDIARAIEEVGIGFLFAPAVHPAMRHAGPVRVELKMRTAFNLLGPLTNPAGANAQLVGAPTAETAELMARALVALGLRRGMVVHGSDGLDEITTTGDTLAWDIDGDRLIRRTLTPEDFGVPRASRADLIGEGREANLAIARAVLQGERGPKRDIVLVNAAAALVLAGRARDWREGVTLAAESIDSLAAFARTLELASFTVSAAIPAAAPPVSLKSG